MLQARFKQDGSVQRFSPQTHYFGYEGRCAFPSGFDCDYCYGLGFNAAILIMHGGTGLMSCVRDLKEQPQDWLACGYPLVAMMDFQVRKGKKVPVITKALVDLQGPLFQCLKRHREQWAYQDHFCSPGPIQFELPCMKPFLAVPPATIYLEEEG